VIWLPTGSTTAAVALGLNQCRLASQPGTRSQSIPVGGFLGIGLAGASLLGVGAAGWRETVSGRTAGGTALGSITLTTPASKLSLVKRIPAPDPSNDHAPCWS